ncbi:hypothetical protein ACI3L1_07600 [Deinococcus sp. SM5_A1]|uniref:hypothetical protein n=1 Tax=Deinococcus sp. SM5_A1 TaxID=3379094 RepID=UPI00385C5500
MRYTLSTEPRFRTLILEVARDLQAQGHSHLNLRLHGDPQTYLIPLRPNQFTFEDYGAHAGVDCRVCATQRDRRFGLFVLCSQGITHGPIGSRCLFEHVFGNRGRELARRLDEIAKDSVHNAEHAKRFAQAGHCVTYLEELGLQWCLQNSSLQRAGLSTFRIREVLEWHKANNHLPRALYRLLDEATPLVVAEMRSQKGPSSNTRAKSSDSSPISDSVAGMDSSRSRDLQNRALRLGARVEHGKGNFHSEKVFATEPIGADHLKRLRTHLAFIVDRLSKAECKRVRDSLSYGHVPVQDVPILVSLLAQAIEASTNQSSSWQEGKSVRRAAWPRARAYVPPAWAVYAENYLNGEPVPKKVSISALKHEILLALDLYAADELASGVNSPLVHWEKNTSRTQISSVAWTTAWSHGLDQHFSAVQRNPLWWRLHRRRETHEVVIAVEPQYAVWFASIKMQQPEDLPKIFAENIRLLCVYRKITGIPLGRLHELSDDELTTTLADDFVYFQERGYLRLHFVRRWMKREVQTRDNMKTR